MYKSYIAMFLPLYYFSGINYVTLSFQTTTISSASWGLRSLTKGFAPVPHWGQSRHTPITGSPYLLGPIHFLKSDDAADQSVVLLWFLLTHGLNLTGNLLNEHNN